MIREVFFSQFLDLPFFTKNALKIVAKQFQIPENTLETNIQRAFKNKELIQLKRGVYVSSKFFIENRTKLDYIFYIASKLLEPSYISRETALQYYGLLTEAASTVITSVSIRTPRKMNNRFGIFDYKKIKQSFFNDYISIHKDFQFFIAEPHKAIFDYLYFRIPMNELRKEDKVLYYLKEFRIDYESMEGEELEKLFVFISNI